MAFPLKTGPLTADDIRDIWSGSVDVAYRQGFEAAGDGNGLEAWGQSWEQLARASLAVDRTTQSMFISPWSGETGDPASGASRSTVTLTVARTGFAEKPLVLAAGVCFYEELQLDHSPDGSEPVLTGRRYTPIADAVFSPGERGPLQVPCVAERPGSGYDNPRPGTITVPSQLGAGFYHDQASVLVTPAGVLGPATSSEQVLLRCRNEADTITPDQVGQYILLTAGSNIGKVARVIGYQPAVPSIDQGATAVLEIEQAVQGATFTAAFEAGEQVQFTNGATIVAYGLVLGSRDADGIRRLTFVLQSGGSIAPATTVLGLHSLATMTVDLYSFDQTFGAEADTAAWRVLSWDLDWGLEVANASSPDGGRHPMLDELGGERAIYRAPGEEDSLYRQRVREISDVVAPNAVRRALNRALGAIPWCFREVGYPELRGTYYDGPIDTPVGGPQSTDPAIALQIDAYDTDVILLGGTLASGSFQGAPGIAEEVVLEDASTYFASARGRFGGVDAGVLTIVREEGALPSSLTGMQVRGLSSGAIFNALTTGDVPATVGERRWRVLFDYVEFRAFFLVGVPPLGGDDFGFAYDAGAFDAYDAAPFDAFYDGYSLAQANVYRRVFSAVDTIRAGGTTWDLYQETGSCP